MQLYIYERAASMGYLLPLSGQNLPPIKRQASESEDERKKDFTHASHFHILSLPIK